MTENLNECHDVAVKAALHVGEIIKTRIWEVKARVETKSCPMDLVTDTDREVENYLISTLKRHFPHHLFIGEESVADGAKCELTDAPTWVIDPVDGTMNFVHGYPSVCVSIALLVDRVPEVAIVFNPVVDLFFEARRGRGATLNGKPIHVSSVTDLSKALVSLEYGTSGSKEKLDNVLANVTGIMRSVHGIRSSGSAALNMAMVAMGGSDAYYEFGVHAWDMAAGDLLVREAGGVVIDPAGGSFDLLSRRVLCASSMEVAKELSGKLEQFYPERD